MYFCLSTPHWHVNSHVSLLLTTTPGYILLTVVQLKIYSLAVHYMDANHQGSTAIACSCSSAEELLLCAKLVFQPKCLES